MAVPFASTMGMMNCEIGMLMEGPLGPAKPNVKDPSMERAEQSTAASWCSLFHIAPVME
jgi:hypothetical protein